MGRYKYLPELTRRLDDLSDVDFDQQVVNEIVLWKVNRYAPLDPGLLAELNRLRRLKVGEHRWAEGVLMGLLKVSGIDLSVASTVLRFRNAQTFQIIDRHAYRAVYGEDYRLYTASPITRKTSAYFDYLDRLDELCNSRGLDFQTIDRLLYVFDKEMNGNLRRSSE